MLKKCCQTILAAICCILVSSGIALAEIPDIQHRIPRDLPALGRSMEFEIKIANFKKFDVPIHMHIVKDGKSMFQTVPKGTLDMRDVPTYTFESLAPEQTLSYSFFFEDNGELVSSKRYTLNRQCMPKKEPVTIPDAPSHIEAQDLGAVAAQVYQIELENNAYEQSIALIKKIKTTVEEFKE